MSLLGGGEATKWGNGPRAGIDGEGLFWLRGKLQGEPSLKSRPLNVGYGRGQSIQDFHRGRIHEHRKRILLDYGGVQESI